MLIAALGGVIALLTARILPVGPLRGALREHVSAVYFLLHAFERTLILLVSGVEVERELQLLLAVVQPVFLIEDDRLIVVPLAAAIIHIVQQGLGFREILCGYRRFHRVELGGVAAVAVAYLRRLVGVAHRVLIRLIQHFQHTRGVRTCLALVKDVLLIISALGFVGFQYLALGRAFGYTEDHKRVTWHLSSPLSSLSICILSPR